MNNDGFGQAGAGPSDMRIASNDLQHARQTQSGFGGAMKEALDNEMQRHNEARGMRLKHLEEHYKR